ncbi:MAG: alpha/beta hydrolase family esterase [Nevskiales bacterium]
MISNRFRLASCVWTVLVVLFTPLAHAQGWQESSITVNGVERWYRVYVPAALPRHAPLLLSLHGGTGSMHTIDKGPTHGWVRLADQQRFLLVAPNGTNGETGNAHGNRQTWNDLRSNPAESQSKADDVGFVRALLDHVEAEYATDSTRVYVTGNSNGGMMTYRLLIEMPDRFAAAAAFIANIPVESKSLRPPARPVPLMIWSGTDDRLAKYNGGEIPGGRGKVRSVPDTVAWWVQANRANAGRVQTEMLPDVNPKDGCRINRTMYPALTDGAPVLFYLAEGGGHTMPTQTETSSEGGPIYKLLVGRTCRDVDGADIAWQFMRHFTSHRKFATSTGPTNQSTRTR